MTNIPRQLKSIIPLKEILQVEDWWSKLSQENQSELEAFYDEGVDHENQLVSIYLCGKFVEQDRPKNKEIFWINHFYDYIINHELFIDETVQHVGGICFSNKVAEEVIKKGLIPKNFKCPESGNDCQMMKILNLKERNKSFQFYLKFKLE